MQIALTSHFNEVDNNLGSQERESQEINSVMRVIHLGIRVVHQEHIWFETLR